MGSGAVTASDPGGGEPKLAPGADVEMTEAAPVDGVKVEGNAGQVAEAGAAAAAMDVEQAGGDAAAVASDLLYGTESAGMVAEDGRGGEPAEGVNGGAGGEEKVQAGAGGLLRGEAEGKPVQTGDVAAPAVASQALEAVGSATPELTVVGPGRENGERDNSVAHYDKETQNNVPGDVVGISDIHKDNGAPAADQLNDSSDAFPQTAENVPDNGTISSSNEPASLGNVGQCARYCLPPLDNGSFRVSDLVWGKVKSHPWWPGEIFDPSDASDLALKHQKKESYLVAYFGDSTFAWCDESQLKPFVTNYSQMEKQSTSDAFVGSVNNALEELSRRILLGMSCSCLPEELSDSGMSYTVENAGLKDGVTCSAVNRSEILKCFSPGNLLHYIKELALFPGQGGDLLELVIACSQLTSFYRSKGCSELASFQTSDAWVEDGMDTSSTQNVMVEEAVISEVQRTQEKPKRGRGRPRKQKSEYDQEVVEKKYASNLNDNAYHDTMGRQLGVEFDDFDNLTKKKRNLDSFDDSEKSSTPSFGSSFKIGECIRRAASQLAGSASIVKAQNEATVYDVVSDDADDELTMLNRAKKRRMYRNHNAHANELLSQLCIAATEPMNGHSFSAMVICYFSDYRNFVVSTATEASIVEKGTSKRGRKRNVLRASEVETTDHMQDSYWSGLSLHNHPIHNLTNESSTMRPRHRRRSSRQTYVPLSELGASPKKQTHVVERSIIHVDEKMVDELKPTALVLNFGRSARVPSEMELIKMFSRYGPLRETDTEVDKDTNAVKVVFKKRSDAERAFSVAGKYGTFGPLLRSYRLVNMPFSLRTSQEKNPETHPEDCGLVVSGQSDCTLHLNAMQADHVGKTDKAEVVEEPAVEQVETTEQASQMEAAGAQAESIAEGLLEQDSSAEQTCIQKEASVEGVSGTTQSAAATDTSNGSLISEIQLAEAPNQALNNDKTNTMQTKAVSETETDDLIKQDLHVDTTNDESAQMVSDNTQMNIVAEVPKQVYVSEDNAGIEQKVGSEAPKQVSDETPCSSKLEAETLTAEAAELDSVDQVKVESRTAVEVSGEQPYSIEQSAQVGAVTEASGTQIEVERQTPEVKGIADAIMEHSVMVQETLKVDVPVEATVDCIAAVPEKVEEIAEEQTTGEEIDEKIENKAAAESLSGKTEGGKTVTETSNEETEDKIGAEASAGKTKEGETAVEAPEFKAESKVIVETSARDEKTGTAEALDEETGTAEVIDEDVEALHKETVTDEKTMVNATIVTPVEKAATSEETVDDAAV